MLLRFACAFLLLATTTGPALAFDTGHHSDLRRSALIDLKFSDSAIKAVQVANWLTDFYRRPTRRSRRPSSRSCTPIACSRPRTSRSTGSSSPSTRRTPWATPPAATTRSSSSRSFGLSLHTLQDFYTHSNWVERHPRGGPAYLTTPGGTRRSPAGWTSTRAGTRTPCIRAVPRRPRSARRLHQRPESRRLSAPALDDAYVFAYAASAEWAAAACRWADEANRGFLDRVRAFSVPGKASRGSITT